MRSSIEPQRAQRSPRNLKRSAQDALFALRLKDTADWSTLSCDHLEKLLRFRLLAFIASQKRKHCVAHVGQENLLSTAAPDANLHKEILVSAAQPGQYPAQGATAPHV